MDEVSQVPSSPPTSAGVWQRAAGGTYAWQCQGSHLCNLKPGWPLLLGCAWSPWEEMLLQSVSQLGHTNTMLSGKARLSSERFWVLFLPLLWENL